MMTANDILIQRVGWKDAFKRLLREPVVISAITLSIAIVSAAIVSRPDRSRYKMVGEWVIDQETGQCKETWDCAERF